MRAEMASQVAALTAKMQCQEDDLQAQVARAEHRAQEEVETQRRRAETLHAENRQLEDRHGEMQRALDAIQQEMSHREAECTAMQQKFHQAVERCSQAEARILEIDAKQKAVEAETAGTSTPMGKNHEAVSLEVQAAVTDVSQELHRLYKEKHELKVTALKKSYADRWAKSVADLQANVDKLSRENEELRVGRNATMTNIVPSIVSPDATKDEHALKQELESARMALETRDAENQKLNEELESNRTEIDELISATEELMALSQTAPARETSMRPEPTKPVANGSRIGRGGTSRLMGVSKVGRSGIMSNIERMGRGRGLE